MAGTVKEGMQIRDVATKRIEVRLASGLCAMLLQYLAILLENESLLPLTVHANFSHNYDCAKSLCAPQDSTADVKSGTLGNQSNMSFTCFAT